MLLSNRSENDTSVEGIKKPSKDPSDSLLIVNMPNDPELNADIDHYNKIRSRQTGNDLGYDDTVKSFADGGQYHPGNFQEVPDSTRRAEHSETLANQSSSNIDMKSNRHMKLAQKDFEQFNQSDFDATMD